MNEELNTQVQPEPQAPEPVAKVEARSEELFGSGGDPAIFGGGIPAAAQRTPDEQTASRLKKIEESTAGEPWKKDLEAIRQEQQQGLAQLQNTVGAFLAQVRGGHQPEGQAPQRPQGPDPNEAEALAQTYRFAMEKDPSLIPQLIAKQISDAQASQTDEIRKIIKAERSQAETKNEIGGQVGKYYGQSLSDPNNPITKTAQALMPKIRQMMAPGTDEETIRYVAVGMAAAQNPQEAAKTVAAQSTVAEERRLDQVQRLSAAVPRSSSGEIAQGRAQLTQEDLDTFAVYDLDPSNPEHREMIAQFKQNQAPPVTINSLESGLYQ
jgi:hypothetical protein